MHIVLAVLSAIGGIVWAIYRLDREGFDFASLNPFLWKRRAHWKQQYEKQPLYMLSSPLEVAGVLMLAIARENGEISLEEKNHIKELMVSELKRSETEAESLFRVSSYLLRERETVVGDVAKILALCKEAFTPEQQESLLQMLESIATVGGAASEQQQALMNEFRGQFQVEVPQEKWT